MSNQLPRGRFRSNRTIRHDIRRALHGAEFSIAEQVVVNALRGDPTAQLAATILLDISLRLGEKGGNA